MSEKIPYYREMMNQLFNDENYHLSSDDEFAYAAGQLIYYLISQSESENLSHAAVEPFLNVSELKYFRKRLTSTFEQYKHKFGFRYERFQRVFSEVLLYESETLNLKEKLPFLLGGYFDINKFYEKKENKSEDNQQIEGEK
jgi:CRISPR-associated protein Csh1